MTKIWWQPTALVAPTITGPPRKLLLTLLLLIGMAHAASISAHAQNCPEPWTNAAVVYGTVTLQGTGNGTQLTSTQIINQSLTAQVQLTTPSGVPECIWNTPLAGSPGAASVNDAVRDVCTDTWVGAGSGSVNVNLSFSSSNTYQIFLDAARVNGTTTLYDNSSGSCKVISSVNSPLLLGPSPGFIQSSNLPLSGSVSVLSGSLTVSGYPEDLCEVSRCLIFANWTLTWNFSPVPDDTVDDACVSMGASDIGCQNQSLGEDILINGTPFSLHYQSDRQFGRGGADPVAISDAQGLGGWTLSVHHVLEPQVLTFCIDGSCSPASRQLKALYLGDGRMRSAAKIQAPVRLNGKVYLTSEDGGEIYVFDGSAGRHLQTLRPLTGAILYNFGYDNAGELISVADAYGNLTKIMRDAKEHPTAIVSPYGQRTTLGVDGNGYLSRVTDPAGKNMVLV